MTSEWKLETKSVAVQEPGPGSMSTSDTQSNEAFLGFASDLNFDSHHDSQTLTTASMTPERWQRIDQLYHEA